MAYRRILTIQDISCIGQCSITVALPILSACGHETCILPSALLSTHTGGFGTPSVTNLQESMAPIWRHWQRQGITFDAIYTGYLGSIEAIATASQIMDELLSPEGRIIVDPAMADHGKLYKGFDEDYASAMKSLCMRADVVIPNITEAAIMTGTSYCEDIDEGYVQHLLQRFCCDNVILTGVGFRQEMTGAAIRCGEDISFYFHERFNKSYSGTGDIFASAFTGAYMNGKKITDAARIAADYTHHCIRNTFEDPAHWYGVKFETALPQLIEMLK